MKKNIPSEEECERLLTEVFKLPEDQLASARLVKTVALRIGRDLKWLRDSGPNISLIKAGALLCHVAGHGPNHDKLAGIKLRKLGYPEVADIADTHWELDFSEELPVSEKEIVFIATKLVEKDQIISVAYKYDFKIEAAKNNPQEVADLKRKKEIAMKIKTTIEHETEKNLEELAIAEN
ncbi:metal-dependent phosphohydrolase [Maridesulfovibrio ferrireducens]|uniref:metal-dependent phosphohydrolase n=1 Tax=Maridesulfovibrio ferrireducens TaxID=246191 RepID=UPI001A35B036|nr:metal-dependent phosphohydrolase [Maridesulfovibrio ferrireducens]MBI9112570.1 metal-dependent phosphohydrolase [Maridesulfovibrio ferrireducens]